MMDKHLHIVAHDVPLPSDSGILKELVFLIKALHAQGILLHVHCFGNQKPESLLPFCHELHLYYSICRLEDRFSPLGCLIQ